MFRSSHSSSLLPTNEFIDDQHQSYLNDRMDPPSLQTRVGGPFLHDNTPITPPSLQTRVGGVISCTIETHGLAFVTSLLVWKAVATKIGTEGVENG